MNHLKDELVSALQRAETAHGRAWAMGLSTTSEIKAAEASVIDAKRRIISADPGFDFSGLLPHGR